MAFRKRSAPSGRKQMSGRQKTAVWVAGSVLGLGILGGALSEHSPDTQNTAAETSHSAAASSSSSAVDVEPTEAMTTTTSAAPLPPTPTMAMTCPTGGTNPSPVFGHEITAVAPYTVAITYGDGDQYANDDQHLAAIFSHTYHAAGTFTVTAQLTDSTGQLASTSCVYSWVAPVVAPAPAPAPAPGPAPAPAPAPSGVVHPGAFCSPVGATGVTSSGTPMVCRTSATDSRARWRSA